MNKLITVFLIIGVSLKTIAQGVLAVPGQSVMIANQTTQISQAIQMLKQGVQTYQSIQAEGQQLVYIKNYMQEASENLKNIGDIKNLKLNQIETILNEVLCIKGENRYPTALKFLNIVNLIMGAYGKCDNSDVFKLSWAGITRNFNDQLSAQGQNVYQYVSQFQTLDQMNQQRSSMNSAMATANNGQIVASSYNSQTNLALAMKYKSISDDLMKTSHELSQALNLEGNDVVQMTKGEKAGTNGEGDGLPDQVPEYEEKYAALLKQSMELSSSDKKQMGEYQRAMGINEMLNFAY